MTRAAIAPAVGLILALLGGCGSQDDPEVAPAPSVAATITAGTPVTEASSPATPGVGTAGLASVLKDARTIAPRLESLYRGEEYPRKLDEVIASLDKAELDLSAGNSLGAYRYDDKTVEFTLCVENSSGAFATYDTAPMALGEQGEEGGCPEL